MYVGQACCCLIAICMFSQASTRVLSADADPLKQATARAPIITAVYIVLSLSSDYREKTKLILICFYENKQGGYYWSVDGN